MYQLFSIKTFPSAQNQFGARRAQGAPPGAFLAGLKYSLIIISHRSGNVITNFTGHRLKLPLGADPALYSLADGVS
ncbi:MAG: hypothetical protein AB1724_00145 [Thermodesulfobacteriota bacterium]